MNPKLRPQDIKKIILETGDEKEHLKSILVSGAIANNQKALKAALLTRDMEIDASIALASSGLIPMEDSVSMGQPPAVGAEELKNKVMDSIPRDISEQEIEEIQSATSEESSSLPSSVTNKPDSLVPQSLIPEAHVQKSSDLDPSSQSEKQSLIPSEEQKPSYSPELPPLPQNPSSETLPKSPQS
jgi:hypothetical protein